MNSPDLSRLTTIIREISDRELPPRFCCHSGSRKPDGSLVTEADVVMQDALAQALNAEWPEFDLLGEEMPEPEQQRALQHSDSGVWCIDPLDGTSNFSAGVPYYAVSVALIHNGRVEAGVVYDPSRKECFSAVRGEGAWMNDQRLKPQRLASPLSEGMALIDLKRLAPELASRLAASPPYKSQRSFGAVALDWCWLAAGRCHVYLHGQQKLWDYAAGLLILEEAGGSALTLEGEPVFSATLTPRSAAAALDPDIFRQWIEWLGVTSQRN
ncbi:myo-inositol-1(or 4)-monophosphatase [Thiogranum longum]|uniref:Myo-inositol-1(Or 4)-monophosphatase n=1 Tax=Thiogranum longum TaxID=1537524 RepID=A0A4R1HCI8_9GAMM|nr:inositol monophosphatase [Thiogranum longum]TCK17920.1 myo-inositol-1(or 4)-monophosphatase [Thiogranum longum]